MNQEVYHIPALLPQVLASLDIKPGGRYVDATYGGGGHSEAIVEELTPEGHLYGFDQDIDAVERSMHDERFTMIHANFRFISNFMRYYGEDSIDGVLADLGVSFHHFDDASRGFSFRFDDSGLDMRMNRMMPRTAADILNTYPEERLTEIFRTYGELKQAHRIASAIVKARQTVPFATAGQLMAVVEPLLNKARVKKRWHRCFRRCALR